MEKIGDVTSGRKLDELEDYFTSYSDLPRDVILKHDLLRVGHWFTDAALELASQALVKSYRFFSYDLIPMKDMKRNEHRKTPEWFTIRRGLYGLRPVSIHVRGRVLNLDLVKIKDLTLNHYFPAYRLRT